MGMFSRVFCDCFNFQYLIELIEYTVNLHRVRKFKRWGSSPRYSAWDFLDLDKAQSLSKIKLVHELYPLPVPSHNEFYLVSSLVAVEQWLLLTVHIRVGHPKSLPLTANFNPLKKPKILNFAQSQKLCFSRCGCSPSTFQWSRWPQQQGAPSHTLGPAEWKPLLKSLL